LKILLKIYQWQKKNFKFINNEHQYFISPNHKLIVFLKERNVKNIHVYSLDSTNIKNCKKIKEFNLTNHAYLIQFSKNNTSIVCNSYKKITILNMKNFTQKTIPYSCNSYSPNTNIFYFYNWYRDDSFIYKIETNEKRENITVSANGYANVRFDKYNLSPDGQFIVFKKRFCFQVNQLFNSKTLKTLNKIKNKKINLQGLLLLKTLMNTAKTEYRTKHPRYHRIELDSQLYPTLINLIKEIPSLIAYSQNYSTSTITVQLNNKKYHKQFVCSSKKETKNNPIIKVQLPRDLYRKTEKGKEKERIRRCKEERIKKIRHLFEYTNKSLSNKGKSLEKADLIIGLF